MKRVVIILFLILLAVFAGYISFCGFVKISPDTIGLVEDSKARKITSYFYSKETKYTFIWQGAIPWRFDVYQIPRKRILHFSVPVAIPELKGLKQDYYNIKIPVNMVYGIEIFNFSNPAILIDNCIKLDKKVISLVSDVVARELNQYIVPVYRPEAILANEKNIIPGSGEAIKEKLKDYSIEMVKFEQSGTISFPDRKIYTEGLLHAVEMRELDKKLEKELKELKSEVNINKLKNKQIYSNLSEISRIIKRNPDILKYIYIDKLAGNVRVILSSDKTGIPGLLESDIKRKKGEKSRDIDNLR